MKLLLLAAAFAASGATLWAQSSVWKVTRGEATLYLGGTCHVLRPADFPLPREFDEAYRAASRIYFETDLARAQSPEMEQIVAAKGMFTDGRTLQSVLSPAAWKAVVDYCTKRGLPVGQLQGMRPWLFASVIAAMELQKIGISEEGVEMHYFQQARADGKGLGELESFEQHLAYVTGMADDRPDEFILNGLEDMDDAIKELPDLLLAWRRGDLPQLEKLLNEEARAKYPELHAKLLVERNHNWMGKLETLLATPEVEFVLAGAGHMPGPDGLVAQLRQRGCRVEQIVAAKP